MTTDAGTNEVQVLEEVIDIHQANTRQSPEVVAADKQYGSADNYRQLRERKITPCISHHKPSSPKGKFGRGQFAYDPENDCFTCPAGETLRPYHRNYSERRIRYKAANGVCRECPSRKQCTDSKYGRRVERHMDQHHIDWADNCLSVSQRRHWMKRRKIVVEGSFADGANNHGFKRARWRGLRKMKTQNLLIATCQNIRKLLKYRLSRRRSVAIGLHNALLVASSVVFSLWFGLNRRFCRIRQDYGFAGVRKSHNCLFQCCCP